MTGDIVAVGRQLADEMLFPDAMRVDRLDVLPAAQLDTIAAAGLYGAGAPVGAGGLGLELPEMCGVVEELASGCLATAFVWIQHFGLLMTLAYGGAPELRETWLGPACQGKLRGGVALTGQIPGPPTLRAEPAEGGWRLVGTAPWVSGWGLVDVLLVMARGPENSVVTLIVDAAETAGLTVSRQRLIAADASVTVRLDFDGVTVPAERFVGQVPFDPAASLRPESMRVNGSLALGVALRCCRLLGAGPKGAGPLGAGSLGAGPLDDELAACRAGLDAAVSAGPDAMMRARAASSELALRAAAVLAVRDGSKSATVDQHAPRLSREALFLLVFASRPGIKDVLLRQLGAAR
jgi:alkylation response protein AidB-like acyl-CoA dehydrogenase